MRVTPAWRTGEQGVAAFDSWCLERSWPMVRVPTERDMGFDAFVQVTDDAGRATGEVFGAQVKAGASYLLAGGGQVPVGGHGEMWRRASVPVIVVVHDPATGELWWGNASEALNADPECRSVTATSLLPASGADVMPLLRSVRLSSDFRSGLPRGLGSQDASEQCGAVWQSFALGFVGPNAMIAVRRVIAHLTVEAATEAIVALAHCTPHPDIFWSDRNMLPKAHRDAIASTFRWRTDETMHLLSCIDENGVDRGSIGQSVYMLLFEDPGITDVLGRVATSAITDDSDTAGWAAYLAVAHSKDQTTTWNDLLNREPRLARSFVGEYIDEHLPKFGFISLD